MVSFCFQGEETSARAAFMSPADISRRFHKPAESEDFVTARKVVRWDPELVSHSDEGTKSKPQQKRVPVTTKVGTWALSVTGGCLLLL